MLFSSEKIKVEDIGAKDLNEKGIPPKHYKVRQSYSIKDAMVLNRISYPVKISVTRGGESLSVIFRGDKSFSDDEFSSDLMAVQAYRRLYHKSTQWGESGCFTIISPYYQQRFGPNEKQEKLLSVISKFLAGQLPVAPGTFIIEKADTTYCPKFIDSMWHNYSFILDELHLSDAMDSVLRIEYGAIHATSPFLGFHPNGYDYVEFKSGGKIRFAFERPEDWRC